MTGYFKRQAAVRTTVDADYPGADILPQVPGAGFFGTLRQADALHMSLGIAPRGYQAGTFRGVAGEGSQR